MKIMNRNIFFSFLLAVCSLIPMSGWADDDPLVLAETQLENGSAYKIYWQNGSGNKFYLKNTDAKTGALFTANENEASIYTLSTSDNGGAYNSSRWYINSADGYRFTNGPQYSGDTNLQLNRSTQERDYETQVIFAKESGGEYVFAVHATNCSNNTSSYQKWGTNTFWTVQNTEAELPNPAYTTESFTPDDNYIWHFEKQTPPDFTQLFGDERNTKKIFETGGPWSFYKSRPLGVNANAYTDGCNYNKSEEHYYYYHSSTWTINLKSDGSFLGGSVTSNGVYYSIASCYQNQTGEAKWFKVNVDVSVDDDSSNEVYIDFYTQSSALSSNLKIKPFYRMYVGEASAHATMEYYIHLANNGCLYIVPDNESGAKRGNKGKFNSLTITAVDVVPSGALKYDATLEYILNVTEAQYATLILPFNAIIPDGLVVYQLTTVEDGNKVYGERLESLEANKPVLVKAPTSGNYTFTSDEDVSTAKGATNGLLTGVYTEYTTVAGDYLLQNQGGNVAFYLVGESTHPKVKPFRAYIPNGSASAKALSFNLDDDVTGINSLAHDPSPANEGNIYNLAGQRVSNPTRGIYVVGGRKVIVK